MRIIKNAIVYKAELPSIDALREHLAERPYSPLGSSILSQMTFIPNPVTGELVTPIEGGLSFSARLDEKIIPAAAIRSALDDRITQIESDESRKVYGRERRQLREDIVVQIAAQHLVKTTVINCLYDQKRQYLIIPVASQSTADHVTGALRQTIGSLKALPIDIPSINIGLTTLLKSFLDGNEKAFGMLTPVDYCQLIHPLESREKVSYQIGSLHDAVGSIKDRLECGYLVGRIGLALGEASFKLTSRFEFKSITFDYEIEYEDAEQQDPAFQWRHEAATQMVMLSRVITGLIDLLGDKTESAAA